MSRFLGIDWDQNQLHILQGGGGRGAVRLELATLSLDGTACNPAQAEAAGKQLRQHLKDAGFEAAPVLATVGRDRVVVKVIRIPKVPDSEEPRLVRFQAGKEMTESENSVIDYFTSDEDTSGRRACVVALKKDVVDFFQQVCKAANLKLLTLTPRAFGVAEAVRHCPVKPGAETTVAVVTLGGKWAEFLILRGEHLLYQRPLTPGSGLLGSVRQNLAAFHNQGSGVKDAERVQAVYLAGAEEHPDLTPMLEQALSLPIYPLDPFAGQDKLKFAGGPRGGFTPLAGLLHLWAARQSTAINFVKPREPVAVADPNRRKKILAALLGVAGVFLLASLAMAFQANEARKEEELRGAVAKLDKELQTLNPEAKQIEALKAWMGNSVSLIDELYDLTAVFPHIKGVHLREISFGLRDPKAPAGPNKGPTPPPAAKDKNKDTEKYHAFMTIVGEVPSGQEREVEKLKDALKDRGRRAKILYLPGSIGKKSAKEFALEIDLGRAPNAPYDRPLVVPGPIIERVQSQAPASTSKEATEKAKSDKEKLEKPKKVEKADEEEVEP